MVKLVETSIGVSPVTQTELVEINSASSHEIPFIVHNGIFKIKVPMIMKMKKLPPKINDGFVLFPNNLTTLFDICNMAKIFNNMTLKVLFVKALTIMAIYLLPKLKLTILGINIKYSNPLIIQ
jgi:hypothetical protein